MAEPLIPAGRLPTWTQPHILSARHADDSRITRIALEVERDE